MSDVCQYLKTVSYHYYICSIMLTFICLPLRQVLQTG